MGGVAVRAERKLFEAGFGDVLAFPFRAARKALSAEVEETIAAATTVAELAALEPQWRALEESAGRCFHAFQSFDWCHTWARAFTCRRSSPFVVTVRQGSELKLVWPLMRTRVGPLTVLRWLSDPFCQYGDVLAAGENPEALIERSWRWIAANSGADAVRLRHVRADAVAHPFLSRTFRGCGEAECAPFMDLTSYPCENAYEARYTKVQRKRRKKIRGELEEIGPLGFNLIEEGEALDRAISQAISAKRAWLAERGLYSQPLASEKLHRFLCELAKARGNLRLVSSVLSAGDRKIAYEIGLRFKGRHYGFITAHDLGLTDASPARLHMDLSQRRAINDRIKVFDLMVPGDPHKASWSNGSVPVFDYYAPLSQMGRLYGKGYLELLRPALRRAYFAAPPSLRKPASKIACL